MVVEDVYLVRVMVVEDVYLIGGMVVEDTKYYCDLNKLPLVANL
jgi:hypothetical protein